MYNILNLIWTWVLHQSMYMYIYRSKTGLDVSRVNYQDNLSTSGLVFTRTSPWGHGSKIHEKFIPPECSSIMGTGSILFQEWRMTQHASVNIGHSTWLSTHEQPWIGLSPDWAFTSCNGGPKVPSESKWYILYMYIHILYIISACAEHMLPWCPMYRSPPWDSSSGSLLFLRLHHNVTKATICRTFTLW